MRQRPRLGPLAGARGGAPEPFRRVSGLHNNPAEAPALPDSALGRPEPGRPQASHCPTIGAGGATKNGTPAGGLRASAGSGDPRARAGRPFATLRPVQQGSCRSVSSAAGTRDRLPRAKGAPHQPPGRCVSPCWRPARRAGQRHEWVREGPFPLRRCGPVNLAAGPPSLLWRISRVVTTAFGGLRRLRSCHLRCRTSGLRARRRVPARVRMGRRPPCRRGLPDTLPNGDIPDLRATSFREEHNGEVHRASRTRSRRVPLVRAPQATAAATPMEVNDDQK